MEQERKVAKKYDREPVGLTWIPNEKKILSVRLHLSNAVRSVRMYKCMYIYIYIHTCTQELL